MLSESERSILYSAAETFLQDFEPRDALIYLEANGTLNQDLSERVEIKPTRLERVREFFRVYIRESDSLNPILKYFLYNKQDHIAEFLENGIRSLQSTDTKTSLKPPLSKERKLNVLLAGQVPSVRNIIHRESTMKTVSDILKDSTGLDSCFTIIHGMAGSGKTSLVSATLSTDPELIGMYYRSVFYLRDSSNTPDQVKYFLTDLLIMLTDEPSLYTPSAKDLSLVAIRKKLTEALLDKPDTLLFIDDVRIVDTVRWLDQLGARVIVTTRNLDIFGAATSPVNIVSVGGFTETEVNQYLNKFLPISCSEDIQDVTIIVYESTSGIPSILEKLVKKSNRSRNRLVENIMKANKEGWAALSCITSYEYNNICDSFQPSIELLIEEDVINLCRMVDIKPDTWIPIMDWSDIIVVDEGGTRNMFKERIYDSLKRLHSNGCFIHESDDHSAFLLPNASLVFLNSWCFQES